MRVIKENGDPCDFKAAAVRGLMRFIDGLFLGIVAFANMHEPLYQRLGDKSASTIVVSAKEENIRMHRPWWRFIVASGIYFLVYTVYLFILMRSMFG
jgi:uncharacterized RDD family membrane protein YckC